MLTNPFIFVSKPCYNVANMIETVILNQNNKDLIPLFCGWQICKKNHVFGPHVRNYYIIHFCLSGKGELHDKFGIHKISAGQLFIIRPGEITTYKADNVSPWEYVWIAFEGNQAGTFNTNKSVYNFPLNVAEELTKTCKKKEQSPHPYLSLLYQLIFILFNSESPQFDITSQIIKYIEFNYMQDINVSALSTKFGFDRSYLYRLFKKKTDMSIKEYLTLTRMEQAKKLLSKGYSVINTAYSVGYKDEFNFSKAFKKYFNISPKDYKKQSIE